MSAKRGKGKAEIEAEQIEVDPNDIIYVELVNRFKAAKNKMESDIIFEKILGMIDGELQRVTNQVRISGYRPEDIYQEAAFALRFKAIVGYDKTRSRRKEIASFEKFAMLCIRRHLSTKFRSSFQNKQRVMTLSSSINEDRSTGDEAVFLSDIIPDKENADVLEDLENKELKKIVLNKLFGRLSDFEKQVYLLFRKKMSYHEIAAALTKATKTRVKVKAVDNALSRLKHKGKQISQRYS